MLFNKLQKIQCGLSEKYQREYSLWDQVISTCRGINEYSLILYNPATIFKGIYTQLQLTVGTAVYT